MGKEDLPKRIDEKKDNPNSSNDDSNLSNDNSNSNNDDSNLSNIVKTIDDALKIANAKLASIKTEDSSENAANFFDIQILMNKLSQFSEISMAMIAAANEAIMAMSRNIK